MTGESRSVERQDPFPRHPAGPLQAITAGDDQPPVSPGAPDRRCESATIRFAAGSITVRSLAGGAFALRFATEPTEDTPSYALAKAPDYESLLLSRGSDGSLTVCGSKLALRLAPDGETLEVTGPGVGDARRMSATANRERPDRAGGRGEQAVACGDAAESGFDGRPRLLQTTGSPFFYRRSRIGIAFDLAAEERVYGLGERMGFLDKRGKSYLNWNSDDPFIRENTDPLYQSIPLAVRFRPGRAATNARGVPERGAGGHLASNADGSVPADTTASSGAEARDASAASAAGYFLDYPGASWFDVDSKGDGCMRIHQLENQMDLYIFPGPGIDDVVAQYTALTGRMPLPPKWALGFHQSRYSYFTAERVEEIAETFRARDIPIDAIYLDIDYMDGYRVFTWNRDSFPDPAALTARLRERGIRVVTIVDPGVMADPDYRVYRDGLARDVFARRTSGEIYHGEVWPGTAVFPDFTNPEARRFWADHHAPLLAQGVSGIWNDMNEPADFTGEEFDRTGFTPPKALMLSGDGHAKGHEHYHNAYANGMAMATREAFAKHRPDERGFVLTRAGYAGIQRHAAVWNGDIDSSWHHLAQSIPMFLNMGLSGVAFTASDIGGFQYNATPELYLRWMQFAVFSPYMRAHTAVDTADHEPWSFGESVERIVAEAIRSRYRYLPYLYSVIHECSGTGRPIMRSLVSAFPNDPRVHAIWDQYLFGPSLMICPVVYPEVRKRHVYLPEGLWVNVDTGSEHEGPCDILADAPLERIPVFVRTPAVIPTQPAAAHTGVTAEALSLHVYPGVPKSRCRFDLYDDDGVSHRAADGEYRLLNLTVESGPAADAADEPVAASRRTATLQVALTHDGWTAGPQTFHVVRGGAVVRAIAASEIPRVGDDRAAGGASANAPLSIDV
ncbi:MAG: TIM-barrel domain-containing protein [Spirochaetales bacterium]